MSGSKPYNEKTTSYVFVEKQIMGASNHLCYESYIQAPHLYFFAMSNSSKKTDFIHLNSLPLGSSSHIFHMPSLTVYLYTCS